MNKSKFIKYSVVLIVIVLIVVTSFFLGWRIALSSLTIGLTSDSSFKTLCDLGNISSSLQKGDTVTVLAGGATAERQPAAVMLKHCIKIAN